MLEHNQKESIFVFDIDEKEPTVICRCAMMASPILFTDYYTFNGKNWNINKGLASGNFAYKTISHPTILLFNENPSDKEVEYINKLNNQFEYFCSYAQDAYDGINKLIERLENDKMNFHEANSLMNKMKIAKKELAIFLKKNLQF